MAIRKISFTNKTVNGGTTVNGKFLSDDANEIKDVINNNADEQTLVRNWVEDKINGTLDDIDNRIDVKLEDLIQEIDKISSDGFITPSEKLTISLEVNRIKSEYSPVIDQLDAYELSSLKSTYIANYSDLLSYIEPIILDINNTSTIDPNEFKLKFENYYTIRVLITKTINLDNKSYIDQANQTLAEVQDITNFWKVTVGNSLLAAGTMLIGTEFENNGGLTGVTDPLDPGKSIRAWFGTDFEDRANAPFRVYQDGSWFSGNDDSSIDFGVTKTGVSITGGLFVDKGGNSTEPVMYRGDFDPNVLYYENNTVTYQGGVWIYYSIGQSFGEAPFDGSDFWKVYLKASADGTSYEYRYKVNGDWENAPEVLPSKTEPIPTGWVEDIPEYNGLEYLWRIIAKKNSDDTLVGEWSNPKLDSSRPAQKGQTVFKSICFKRSDTPITVAPNGGDFNNPIPSESSGWYDGIPPGNQILYASHRIFADNGLSPQQNEWSIPQIMADSPDIDFEWSSIEINPGNPKINPLNWNNDPVEGTIWMAVARKYNGVWSEWVVTKIAGERGMDGVSGNSTINSIVFTRSSNSVGTPIGGSFSSPMPTTAGWSDGIPNGMDPVWASRRLFSFNGESPQESVWSTPKIMADSPTLDFEWSSSVLMPLDPDSASPGVWYNEPNPTSIWRAMRTKVLGKWEPWVIEKVKGEKGADGDGIKGDNGPTGPFVVRRGEYRPALEYYGGTDMVQVVDYAGDVYHTLSTAGTFIDIPPIGHALSDTKWKKFQQQIESLAVSILDVTSANIDTLTAGRFATANGRLTINEEGNNSMNAKYANGQVGLAFGTDEDGMPVLRAFNEEGDALWDLGAGNLGFVTYVTTIPEKWTPQDFMIIGTTTSSDSQLKVNLESKLSYSNGLWYIRPPQAQVVTYYYYNAGDNTNTEANKQYNGWHTTQVKSTTNWVSPNNYIAYPGPVLVSINNNRSGSFSLYTTTGSSTGNSRGNRLGRPKRIQLDLPVQPGI